ncbi:MAG: class I SAM-dependent methyltransferase [Chloroflexi bacterium]|nr:MAG: class I SAM-dependent methyltransferase [Chloroflexota bacterium]
MNYYNRKILPKLMDSSMATPDLMRLRRKLLAQVHGQVLEIGMGGGHNLACYPPGIRQITAVDVHSELIQTAVDRAQQVGITVDYHPVSAERLPFAGECFDSVVSTWTLCSIPDVNQALEEIHRVLRPGGDIFFIEHGLSPDAKIRTWQNRLTPLQKFFSGGCHLNRDIPALLRDAGFTIKELQTFYLKDTPRISGYSFMGTASK